MHRYNIYSESNNCCKCIRCCRRGTSDGFRAMRHENSLKQYKQDL